MIQAQDLLHGMRAQSRPHGRAALLALAALTALGSFAAASLLARRTRVAGSLQSALPGRPLAPVGTAGRAPSAPTSRAVEELTSATAPLPGDGTNLAQLFRERTARFGGAPRWRQQQGQTWRTATYVEQQRLVHQVMGGLDALGARPGDAIGILSNTRWEWVVADWAITCLGGVTTAIYPSLTPQTIDFILRDANVRFLFVEDAAQFQKVRGVLAGLPHLRRLILFDGDAQALADPASISFDALMALVTRSAEEADAFAEARAAAIGPDDLATLIYTSGTTGVPKGVVHTHRTLLAQLAGAHAVLTTVRPGMSDLLFLPLAHVLGRVEQLFSFEAGGVTIIEPSLDHLARDLARVKPDVLVGVPRVYEKAYAAVRERVSASSRIERAIFHWAERVGREAVPLRQAGRAVPVSLRVRLALADRLVFSRVRAGFGGRLQFAISGGAPLDPDITRFFHAVGIPLLEGWGLTETGGALTSNRVEDFRLGTVGRPFPGHEVRIAADGEILVRGPCIFSGYLNNPAATAEALDAEGWFHTGDIGTLDADGFLTIVDRKKELIATAGGKKIAPQQVESLLDQVPLVAQACVYGDRKPYVVALLTLDWPAVRAWAEARSLAYRDVRELAGAPALRAYLDEHVAQVNAHLARYEQIKYYGILADDFTVENGLLTPTLKLRRRAIDERYHAQFEALYRPAPAASA